MTVIIATYDYSAVLRHAVRSVLAQTYTTFELLVVGDACSDDSGEVVASFADPRVEWINREENAGTQAGPNNTGLERAAGKYVAYLGHDDLWHPWHLEALVGAAERTGAGWVHGLVELIGPPGSRRKLLGNLYPGLRPPGRWVPPTSVMHRTDAARELRWRHYEDAEDPPDVDFFDRLQREVGPPVRVPALTSFKFVATWRPNCYRDRPDAEQAALLRRMERDPRFLRREAASLLFHRLSPFHGKLPPPPEKPAGAGRGWLTVHARRVRGLD
ncbi:MAG TPA: glycosyltransferase family A protein [Solirubrobacteraceae bacterium]